MEAPHEGGREEDRPRAGRDYPRDWPEFQRFFPDEQACLDYLERLRWPRATKPALEGFVCEAVAPGGQVRTDGWNLYGDLPQFGYRHDPINVSRSGRPASASIPHVHRVFALLKRWLLGTHQGSVAPQQLDYYLDEFTFRFNRRRSRYPGLLFYRLLQETLDTEPIPLKRILGGEQGREGTGRSGRG